MKEYVHPKFIELYYHNEETDELKMITIPWNNITKFEMNNISTQIKSKNTMLIKKDVIGELDLVATKIISANDPENKIPLHEIVPFDFELYEITIIDTNNQRQTYGINKNPNHLSSKRHYDDFRISYY